MQTRHLLSFAVDSDRLARQERFERWRMAIGDTYDVSLPAGPDAGGFDYRIRFWQHDRLLLSQASFSPRRQCRGPRNIRRDQVDHFRLILQTGGCLRLDADGRRHCVQANQLLLSDLARPEVFETSAGSNIVLFVPRGLLEDALPGAFDLHGVALRGALAGVLGDHLRSLAAASHDMTEGESVLMSRITVDLLAGALAPTLAGLGRVRAGVENLRLRQASRYIELHLGEADLTAERLCRFLGLSRSAVYRLYAPFGGVANYIRERRLAHAHDALAAGGARSRISAVAEAHGFGSATQFSRAFREQFGYSPRDTPSAWMAAAAPQPGQAGVRRGAPDFTHWLRALRE